MTLEQDIAGRLKTQYMARSLFCFEKIGSTNDFLKGAAGDLPDGCAAVTLDQTAGRGRRGNAWTAPRGEAAAVSVLIKSPLDAVAPPVTLVLGLAAAKALGGLCGAEFLIKWPNDIVCGGKKVCGILCESKLAPEGGFTVCGIGINLSQSPEFFTSAGIPQGASLSMCTKTGLGPAEVVAAVINAFEKTLEEFRDGKNTAAFIEEYSKNCVTLGREVRALTSEGELRGTAEAINPDGTLKVECASGAVTLAAGDVSVRGVMDYI